MMTIFAGTILKNLRKSRRYSQKQLADQLIVSRPTYERYENDSVEIPLSKLCAVARFYQIEPLEFIGLVLSADTMISRMSRNRLNVHFPERKDLYG